MTESFSDVFDYLHDRAPNRFKVIVSEFQAAGLPTPAKFGPDEAQVPVGQNKDEVTLRALNEILELALKDYDVVLSKVKGKARNRSRLKLIASIISAVSASSLLSLLAAGNGSSLMGYAAALLALIASLITIVQDYVGTSTSTFWQILEKASGQREAADGLRTRIRLITTGALSESVEKLVQPTTDTVGELRKLLSALALDDLRAA